MILTRRAFFAFSASLGAAAQEITFRADVQLVRLLATVKDASGAIVAGLQKDDFALTDNGAAQQISIFERNTSQPLSVAIMLDISGSTARELKYEVDSLHRFAAALFNQGNPEDQAAVFTFNWEVVIRTPFTRRIKRVEDALRGVKAEAGTSLYDAITLGAKELTRRDG